MVFRRSQNEGPIRLFWLGLLLVVLWYWDGHRGWGKEQDTFSMVVFPGLLVVVSCLWGEIVTGAEGGLHMSIRLFWLGLLVAVLWFGNGHREGTSPDDRTNQVDVHETTRRVKNNIFRSSYPLASGAPTPPNHRTNEVDVYKTITRVKDTISRSSYPSASGAPTRRHWINEADVHDTTARVKDTFCRSSYPLASGAPTLPP